MSDSWDLVEKIGLPVAGLIGGWIGAALRIETRVRTLIESVKQLKEDEKKNREETKQGLRLELVHFHDQMEEKISNIRREISGHKSELDRMRDTSHDYAKDATLANFMSENNERWERTERSLGTLEGMLNTLLPLPRPRR